MCLTSGTSRIGQSKGSCSPHWLVFTERIRSCKQSFKMSFSHSNPDIIIKSSLFSKVTFNFGHRDMRHIKEELSEGTTTSDSSEFRTPGYEETDRAAKYFTKFQTSFEAEISVFFRTDNSRQGPKKKYHPSLRPSPVSQIVKKDNCTRVKTFRKQCS